MEDFRHSGRGWGFQPQQSILELLFARIACGVGALVVLGLRLEAPVTRGMPVTFEASRAGKTRQFASGRIKLCGVIDRAQRTCPMLEESEMLSLMSRPDLPLIAESINAKLRDEDAKRMKFRNDLTPSVKAEFIAGEVVMHSPAKAKHLRATEKLVRLLATFSDVRQLGEVFTEKALICLTRNDYEPDVCFFKSEKAIGFHSDTMEFPAPDFVVEVLSDSTAARDRGVKFEDYAQHGIGEYWIIDCDEQSIEQFVLRPGETAYHLAHKLTEGEIESVVVSGFRIPVAAVFDSEQNQQALKSILA